MHRLIMLFLISSIATAGFFEDAIKYLASDELQGRRSGTEGNEIATTYSIEQFKKIGLDKFADSYKQEFTIFTKMEKGDKNYLFSHKETEFLFQPISYSLSGELTETEMVFVGFGITVPKSDTNLIYDDYANIDVKDKIVVVMTGDPGIGNAQSKFRHPDYANYRSIFYKLKNAITHGAKGIIILQDPLSLDNYPNEENPFFNATEGGGSRFSIISGYATNKWFNKHSPIESLNAQNKITKTQKPGSFVIPGKYTLAVSLKKKTGRVSNVVGVIPGSDETLKKEVVVIGGHFDHLGLGGESSMDPRHHGQIHPGADDNASGTALVIKLAKELKKKDLKRTYIFVLFNAEEVGLLGSDHFVEMWARHGKTYGTLMAMLNFDMVGRYTKEVSIMGATSGLEWKKLLSPLSSKFNFVIKDSALGSSDHASFTKKQIPALFFTTGAHEDYHTAGDTSDKINYDAIRGIESYSLSLIDQIERTPSISFNPDYNDGSGQGRSRGYGAHLGCVPEFGQSDDIVGVHCTRASDNSPAMIAGIIAGDILVQIGDIEIKSIYDLAFALKYYRAGDLVELGWKRDGKLMKKSVKLAKSRRH